jgi:hypothetical protein
LSLSMKLACFRTGFDATPLGIRLPYGLVAEWQGGARQFTITVAGLDSVLSRKHREAPKCCEDQPL